MIALFILDNINRIDLKHLDTGQDSVDVPPDRTFERPGADLCGLCMVKFLGPPRFLDPIFGGGNASAWFACAGDLSNGKGCRAVSAIPRT